MDEATISKKFDYDTTEGYRIRVYGSERGERDGLWYTLFRRLDTDEYGKILAQAFDRFAKPIKDTPKPVVVPQVFSNVPPQMQLL